MQTTHKSECYSGIARSMVTGGSQRTGNGDARGWRTILGEAVEQRKWNEGVAMMVAVSKIRGVFSLSLSFRLSLCLSVSVSLCLCLPCS